MKKQLIFATLLTFFFLSSRAFALPDSEQQNRIDVMGYATMKVKPDMAYLSIILNENDVAIKSKGVEYHQEELYKSLKKCGIDVEKQLTVSSINTDYSRRKNVATVKRFLLKVTELDKLPEIYGSLSKIGIGDVSIVKFDISNREELELEVKAKAVKNGRHKANVLATAADAKVGKLVYIGDFEHGYTDNSFMMRSAVRNESASADHATISLDFSDITLSANISCAWEIGE